MSKKSSYELFDLIKSMTKSEKRYFKVWIDNNGNLKKDIFTSFFNEINNQEYYNEEEVKKKVGVDAHLFSKYKERTFELILNSLRRFNERNSLENQLNLSVINAEILFNKMLYKSCTKLINKIKVQAKKNEFHLIKISVLKLENKVLLKQMENDSVLESYTKNVIDLHKSIDAEKNELLYENLYQELINLIVKSGHSNLHQKNIEQFSKTALLGDESNATTFSSRINYYLILRLQNYYLGNRRVSFSYAKKAANLFEDYDKYSLEGTVETYCNVMHLLLVESALSKDKYEFEKTLIKLKNLFKNHPELKRVNFPRIFISHSLFIENTLDYDGFDLLVKEFKRELSKFKGSIPFERVVIVYFNLACLYIIKGDYKGALLWINKILNNKPSVNFRRDIYACSRMMNILIHFEQENYKLLKSLTKRYYAQLFKVKDPIQSEKCLLDFFLDNMDLKNNRIPFEILYDSFIVLRSKEKTIHNNFNFIMWIKSKMEHRTMKEILKEDISFE